MNQELESTFNIESHLSAGAEAWVILNSENFWWKEIDFRTQFSFSQIQEKLRLEFTRSKSSVVEKIETVTELPTYSFKKENSLLFYPAKKYFKTDWIVLVTETNHASSADLIQQLQNLKVQNVRVFSPLEISSGLKTSFKHVELISEPI